MIEAVAVPQTPDSTTTSGTLAGSAWHLRRRCWCGLSSAGRLLQQAQSAPTHNTMHDAGRKEGVHHESGIMRAAQRGLMWVGLGWATGRQVMALHSTQYTLIDIWCAFQVIIISRGGTSLDSNGPTNVAASCIMHHQQQQHPTRHPRNCFVLKCMPSHQYWTCAQELAVPSNHAPMHQHHVLVICCQA